MSRTTRLHSFLQTLSSSLGRRVWLARLGLVVSFLKLTNFPNYLGLQHSLARHTPQSEGKEGSGDSVYSYIVVVAERNKLRTYAARAVCHIALTSSHVRE